MQFSTVRSKEKDYGIYLKVRKTGSQLFGEREKQIPAIYRQKMQITTDRSKEKDYDNYLKSEKLVHSNYEYEKNVSQLFRSGKKWFLAISTLKNTVAAIWKEKKVDPCYFITKKCSSQLFGARKKIMTAI